MKSAHTQPSTRKWPAAHGLTTYNFTPAPPEVTKLHKHINTLEHRIEEQAALIAALSEKANHDSLTGLLNRQGMETALENAITNYKRYGHHGALMMLDLNHFKRVNDTFGHAAGDSLLRHVAAAMRECTRTTDSISRLGGDEFMVYLLESNLANAMLMARRLRQHLTANPLNYEGNVLTAHISVGIATMDEAPALPGLIELADSRMYRLKQALKQLD